MEGRGTIRMYAAGGCGLNNVGYFVNQPEQDNCANIETAFIDTSRSNLESNFNEEDIFVFENTDGSGKIRTENHGPISQTIRQITVKHPPGDLNVVVFSASGGSGSVIGPLLVSHLLSTDQTVLCIVVGSDESLITATNTLNTLKSLESLAQRNDKPVVMYYEHNDADRSRSEINSRIQLVLSTLAVLAYKGNREIDSQDLFNWVYFNRTTPLRAQLAQLEVYDQTEYASRVEDPVSAVSLYDNVDREAATFKPEYHAAGYMEVAPPNTTDLHYVITVDYIQRIVDDISGAVTRYRDQRDSRVERPSILDDGDSAADDGMVF